jgi:hypothetical protein
LSVTALAICGAVIAVDAQRMAWWALSCAWLPLVALSVIRRIPGRKPMLRAALAAANLLVVALFATQMLGGGRDGILRNAALPASSNVSLAQRMQADTPLLGSGAGSYSSLVPIYRTFGDAPGEMTAPTTAAALAVENGWPVIVALTLFGLACGFVLFDRALQRGRDSFYPAVGGGCALMSCFNMFIDNSLLGTTVATISVVIIGLAFGQSLSTRRMLD